MISTPFIRDCIVDKDKTHLINGAISAGMSQYGMQVVRPVDLQPVLTAARVLRGSAPLGEQRRRVQAAGPGHLDDQRDEPRPDRQERRARNHPVWRLARTSTASRCWRGASCPKRRCGRRLARKEHAPDAIDEAVVRLLDERAIDDTRVADAIARTETTVHRRGKQRVRLQIERAGIAKSVARRAVDEVFGDIDPEAHLEAALKKRLHGRDTIADDREFQRLFRYLLGQGFETDQVMKALTARRRR